MFAHALSVSMSSFAFAQDKMGDEKKTDTMSDKKEAPPQKREKDEMKKGRSSEISWSPSKGFNPGFASGFSCL